MLEKMGYTVLMETDPLKVLEHVKAHPDDVDLVISDMTMPGLTGDRLAEELLKIRQDLPVIVCTGYSERISPEIAMEMGIKVLIMKPFEMDALGRSVRKVLDGETGENEK